MVFAGGGGWEWCKGEQGGSENDVFNVVAGEG